MHVEIAALLQRTYGVDVEDEHLLRIAMHLDEAIMRASDTQLGVLRHLAQILTPAAHERGEGGPAIVQAVMALREAGITYVIALVPAASQPSAARHCNQ
jgi:hypothetical protein